MALKVGVFGTFFPESNFGGNSTTPIVVGLTESGYVDTVEVFCQSGSLLPPGTEQLTVRLRPSWRHNRPLSLFPTAAQMYCNRDSFDLFLFNIFMTSFGRTRSSNGVGLLLPPALTRLGQIPVVVYMHNLVETQDIRTLGYDPSGFVTQASRWIELQLLKTAKVVVPLQSQAEMVRNRLGHSVEAFFFPFLEGFLAARWAISNGIPAWTQPRPEKPRILMMGTWGPQKDLRGALASINLLRKSGFDVEVTVTGSANPNFPSYYDVQTVVSPRDESAWIHYLGRVSDADLFKLILSHDLVVLPYLATGGYSGAMNLAAAAGTPIVAFDLPQLREQAALLGADVSFVQASDLGNAIRAAVRHEKPSQPSIEGKLREVVRRTSGAMDDFANRILRLANDR